MSDPVTPEGVPASTPTQVATKPGYKTTEFWLSAAAAGVGLLLASGAVPATGPYSQVVGMVVGLLAAMGYSIPRTAFKATQATNK